MQHKDYLKIDDIKGFKANMHTHTARCKHAIGEDREYVENAIKAGYEILGFSDHAPYLFDTDFVSRIRMGMDELDGYIDSIESLKKEYASDIKIYTGFELEYFPRLFDKTFEVISQYPVDYFLLGQHYFDEESPALDSVYKHPYDEKYLELYVNRVKEGIEQGIYLYVAHPDIIKYDGPIDIYQKHMNELSLFLKSKNIPIEINEAGLLTDKVHYPDKRFLEICKKNNNDFIIGVDAHMPERLLVSKEKSTLNRLEEYFEDDLNKLMCI